MARPVMIIGGLIFAALIVSSGPVIPRRLQVATNGRYKTSECRLKRGTMKIYIPGCEQKMIKSLGCKGFCLSSSKPGMAKGSDMFYKMCNCCQPEASMTRDVFLNCPAMKVKRRRVRIYVATKCHCKHC
eukprot:gene3715-4235_t